MPNLSPLYVAFFAHDTGLYGANRSLLALIEGLGKYGVRAHVVSPHHGDLTKRLEERGIPVAVFPIQWWVGQGMGRRDILRRVSQNLRLLPALGQQLRSWKIEVLYTNSTALPIGAMLAKWMRLPHVWHLREFGELDYGWQPDWGQWAFRKILHSADAKIAISEAISAHFFGAQAAQNVYVIYNGVASEAEFDQYYAQAHRADSSSYPYTFALVGLIHPNKGQEVAIQALALVTKHFPYTRLVIAGKANAATQAYQEYCQQLAVRLGIGDKVEFWGYLEEPYQVYSTVDAVLMCSIHEAMGRTTVEAMSACRPVIGYDHAGTSELIEHEYTGLLYRDGPEGLAACMLRFLENPAWARQLGENAWQVARKKYTTEVYAQQVYTVLQSVVAA